MIDFNGKKVAVIGLGVEGISSAKYLKKHGAKVTELDKNPTVAKAMGDKARENYLENLNQYDLIVRSPGVKISKLITNNSSLITSKITSQTKLFFDLCPCPIIGVTGTKGKGTTSSLIYEMLKRERRDSPGGEAGVYLGGNIGKPPFDFLDKLKPQSLVVLELSSFQLQDLTKSPHIAVMLMTTSEHLKAWGDANYHESIEEYVDAKRNILRFQNSSDFAIINRDYSASNESDIHSEGKVYYISRERSGRDGCYIEDGWVWLKGVAASIDKRQTSNDTGSQNAQRIIKTDQIFLPGKHNLENAMAAIVAATLAGVSKENMVKVLRSFKGLEHRLELVRTVNGVAYYDDSFSTTPETAIAAIEAFTQPEILILGGSSKGSDFSELGSVISSKDNIKAIIGIGVEWERIKAQFKVQSSKFKVVEGVKDMRSIVQKAKELAEDGDVVLLSPACASFDMFKNYKDRGEQFKREVKKLLDRNNPS